MQEESIKTSYSTRKQTNSTLIEIVRVFYECCISCYEYCVGFIFLSYKKDIFNREASWKEIELRVESQKN